MLKHISTLNVAILVLLLALLRDFSAQELRTDPPLLALITLACFFSLLLGMGSLFYTLVGRAAAETVRNFVGAAYFVFIVGLLLALWVGLTAPDLRTTP